MNEREKSRSGGKYQQQHPYEANFDYTSPRPPALGEERTHSVSEQRLPSMDRTRHQNQKSSSPIPKAHYEFDDGGSCRPNSRPSSRHENRPQYSPPACYSWARSLHNLLQDPDGVKLFLRYLESEGPQYAEALHFWFACEGLKNHNQIEKIQRLVKLIHKTYFMKSALPINEELRKQITKNMKLPQCLDPPVTLFDEAQAQVEHLINNTTYPNFFKSDIYLQYLQSVQNPSSGSEDFSSESSSSSSSVSNKELVNLASGVGPLPTLHEGMEFIMNAQPQTLVTPGTASVSTGYHTPTVSGSMRLTKDMLLRSQKHRALDIRPKSETFAGLFMNRSGGVHAAYNSYNPVSRQDSEMQSLSSQSDARTESDNMSLAENSVDGGGSGRTRQKAYIEAKHLREKAAINRETNIHPTFIPRTQRMDINNCKPMTCHEHAALLREKLEKLLREQESQELLARKLKESDSMSSLDDHSRAANFKSQDLETAIREKLQFQDDNDQDILDEHVSRVFSDHSLSISPSLASPRPLSPSRARWSSQSRPGAPHRRDRDLFSTFSGDSGNVHDFAEQSEHRSLPKSKSIPEHRRSASKKTLTDLTDSGVSVVSETASVGLVQGPKDRVLTWLMGSDRSGRVGGNAHSEMAIREGIGRKYARKYGSRSNSLERNSVTGSLEATPGQPFVADPSMPPLPAPNTSIGLEEVRRRLEDEVRAKSRQRSSNKYYPDILQSGQSTLRKSMRNPRPILPPSEDVTTVVFSFCEEQVPYRTKIPGSQITLRQFKEVLPKKGNYRYFFKTICEDLSNQVTNEEVSNDSEVLPLWEGKIMAQVKPID